MSAPRVAFLGLGAMGIGMARNLVAAGLEVTVWNRTAARAREVEGARAAATPAEAVAAAEIAVTMLADDAAVEAVTFGADGLLGALRPGAVHLGMSTISTALARRLTEAHRGAGQAFVAAPVFGRPDAAAARKLWIVPGGEPGDLARCGPVFDALGQGIFTMPGPEEAVLAKLAGNFLLAATTAAVAEALALGEKGGIEPDRLLEMLTGTLFGSPAFTRYGGLVARTEFEPAGFPMALGLKDVNLVLQAAGERRVPMPIAAIARDHLLAGLARGREHWDWAGLAASVRESAGLPPTRRA